MDVILHKINRNGAMKQKNILIALFIGASLVLFFWPIFRWLWNSWLYNDYYSHGFLVPVIAAALIWTKRDYLKEREPTVLGTLILALGAVVYVIGYTLDMRILGGVSLIIVITAIFLSVFGLRATRAILFPLVFLGFMIPPPFIQELGYRLQAIAIDSSTWVLDTLGLSITTTGTKVELGDVAFNIGLPCSGTHTLIALLALMAVYVYILKGSLYRRTALYVLAVPIAIFSNILRIVSIILVAYYIDEDVAGGWYHDVVASPLFFFVGFLFLVLLGWIMKCRLNYDMLK